MLRAVLGEPENDEKFIYCVTMYFNNVYEDEWFDDEFAQKMLADVDDSEVVLPGIVKTPFGYQTYDGISDEMKTLLLIYNLPDMIFSTHKCGDKCGKWMTEIAKKHEQTDGKDITAVFYHCIHFEKPFEIYIVNNDKVIDDNCYLAVHGSEYFDRGDFAVHWYDRGFIDLRGLFNYNDIISADNYMKLSFMNKPMSEIPEGDFNDIGFDEKIITMIDNIIKVRNCLVISKPSFDVNDKYIHRIFSDEIGVEVSQNEIDINSEFNREELSKKSALEFSGRFEKYLRKKYPSRKFCMILTLDDGKHWIFRFHRVDEFEKLWLDTDIEKYNKPVMYEIF